MDNKSLALKDSGVAILGLLYVGNVICRQSRTQDQWFVRASELAVSVTPCTGRHCGAMPVGPFHGLGGFFRGDTIFPLILYVVVLAMLAMFGYVGYVVM